MAGLRGVEKRADVITEMNSLDTLLQMKVHEHMLYTIVSSRTFWNHLTVILEYGSILILFRVCISLLH
jgi:hypothetical protein